MQYQDAVATIIASVPQVSAIYLFGSQARGDIHGSSDVDLAILARAPLDPLFRFELQEKLAGMLHASCDLIDLRAASTVMRVQVLRDARLPHDSAAVERGFFEAAVSTDDVAVHDYTRLHLAIVRSIIERNLDDLLRFASESIRERG